ncbi:hypothetical protein PYJP_17290 [Pyrofollis japonicus]|uniref:hypothetical protein n=1 Tax=Pyrofollis japonicus TaxID=3060460 RepID=UPI00295BA5EB|nr:hypothetical protein [Pyrofollis japonicus]BEP18377.1 hypothetical protein PYJP_17290 [Pyrofollis japonicus]
MIHAVYAVTAGIIIGVAIYGLLTVKHLVKLIVYFLLMTSGLMLYSTLLPGETKLPYIVMILSAIEEIMGLVLVIVYHGHRKTGLIAPRKGGRK